MGVHHGRAPSRRWCSHRRSVIHSRQHSKSIAALTSRFRNAGGSLSFPCTVVCSETTLLTKGCALLQRPACRAASACPARRHASEAGANHLILLAVLGFGRYYICLACAPANNTCMRQPATHSIVTGEQSCARHHSGNDDDDAAAVNITPFSSINKF